MEGAVRPRHGGEQSRRRVSSGGQKMSRARGPKSRHRRRSRRTCSAGGLESRDMAAAAEIPALTDPTRPTQQTRPARQTGEISEEISEEISREVSPAAGREAGRPRAGAARPRARGGGEAVGASSHIAGPPDRSGSVASVRWFSRSSWLGRTLDAADHGPRGERDHVAAGERDVHDAVGLYLHHEHAAADRPPGERHDDRRKARTERGGRDDAWRGHGVTRSSA